MHTSVSPRARIESLNSHLFNAEELFLYLRRNIYNCRHYKAHRECVWGIFKIQKELTTLEGQFEFLLFWLVLLLIFMSRKHSNNKHSQNILQTNAGKIQFKIIHFLFTWCAHPCGTWQNLPQSTKQDCDCKPSNLPGLFPLRFKQNAGFLPWIFVYVQ